MTKIYSALLHTHETLITLYVLIFLIKVILLLANKREALDKFRKKTRVIGEMVLPSLFLLSGIYLATVSNAWGDGWFLIKIGLVIVTIITGIFTFRQNNKMLGILTLLIFVYIILLSYRKNPALTKEDHNLPATTEAIVTDPSAPGYDIIKHGQFLYHENGCATCHGNNGALGNHGAANLALSPLDDAAIESVIANGRGSVMAAYSSKMTSAQIHAVAQYVKTFRHP